MGKSLLSRSGIGVVKNVSLTAMALQEEGDSNAQVAVPGDGNYADEPDRPEKQCYQRRS